MEGLRGVGWASRPSRAVPWVESKASVSQKSPATWGWLQAKKASPQDTPGPARGSKQGTREKGRSQEKKRYPPEAKGRLRGPTSPRKGGL